MSKEQSTPDREAPLPGYKCCKEPSCAAQIDKLSPREYCGDDGTYCWELKHHPKKQSAPKLTSWELNSLRDFHGWMAISKNDRGLLIRLDTSPAYPILIGEYQHERVLRLGVPVKLQEIQEWRAAMIEKKSTPPTAQHTPSLGAMKAARFIVYHGLDNVEAIATIIDNDTSAPDLLAALQALVKDADWAKNRSSYLLTCDSLKLARAAIAKAKGN